MNRSAWCRQNNSTKGYAADHVIGIQGKSPPEIAGELSCPTGQEGLDAIIDCAGAPEMIQLLPPLGDRSRGVAPDYPGFGHRE